MMTRENAAKADRGGNGAELAKVLSIAAASSGKTRCAIARDAGIHKDSLRRVLAGTRVATLDECARILRASGYEPRAALLLLVIADGHRSSQWLGTAIALFLEEFLCELPGALERVLGNQLQEVRPKWGKGTALRVARFLSDHIDELDRRDALYVESA